MLLFIGQQNSVALWIFFCDYHLLLFFMEEGAKLFASDWTLLFAKLFGHANLYGTANLFGGSLLSFASTGAEKRTGLPPTPTLIAPPRLELKCHFLTSGQAVFVFHFGIPAPSH